MRRDPGALFAAVAGTAALALAALDLARHRAFWSPDSGLRFLQVEALVRQGYRRVSIPYPGARFDPGARYLPFGDWFLVRRGGQLCVVYPPYFPALASLPYRALGFAGLLVLPLAGAVAVLRIIAHLQKASEPPWPALAVLAVLSTPLAVYGLLFWDHAPAAGLGAGAAALVTAAGRQKRDAPAFLSGLLAGLGLWLRTEMYLFTVALMLAAWRVFGRRVAAWVAVGALVPALAVWTLNLHLFGHPLGLKGEAAVGARVAEVRSAAQAVEGWAKRRLLVAYDLLISTEQPQNGEQPERIGPSLAVSGAVVAGSALLTWGAWSRDVARILVGAGGCRGRGFGPRLRRGHRSAPHGFAAHHAVCGRPPAGRGQSEPGGPVPPACWTLYFAAVLATASVGGLQWGPRYLLPAIPLIVWAAVAALAPLSRSWPHGARAMHLAVAILTAGGLTVQAAGVLAVRSDGAALVALQDAIERRSAPVLVSGAEPVLRALAPLYFRRVLLRVDGPEALRDLVRTLSRYRVREWTYVPFTGARFDRRRIERWSEEAG